MSFKLQIFDNLTATLKDLRINEAMHSSIGPLAEAKNVYIDPSELTKRLNDSARLGENLVVWDVGLGIAGNALALLSELEVNQSQRVLNLVSFELHLEGLERALKEIDFFPFLKARRTLLDRLLADRFVEGPGFEWSLHAGNFFDHFQKAPAPELIFYDFYSPKVCPELWGLQCFQQIYEKLGPLREAGIDTRLLTYTHSTAVRSALCLAGFYVGSGPGTCLKTETTQASTVPGKLRNPLGQGWFEHLERSAKPFPLDCQEDPTRMLKRISEQLEKW